MTKLPSGVFRCIIEYQFPNTLSWKYSDPFMPLKGKQDRHFPAIDKLDYENYLVVINEIPGFEYQFTLSNGANCGTKGSEDNWECI